MERFPSSLCYPIENSPVLYHQTFTGLNWYNYWTVGEEPRNRDALFMSNEETRFTASILYKYQKMLGLLSDEDSEYLQSYRYQQAMRLSGIVAAPAC